MDCIVLFPPALLVTTLPISIAGWGVRELAMVAVFALVGVPADGASVLSILFGLLDALISLPGGVLWVLSGDKRADVIAAASAPGGKRGVSPRQRYAGDAPAAPEDLSGRGDG